MAAKTRKKHRKKVRYRVIKLKLTANQHRSLLSFCTARKTTPNKLIKKLLKPRLQYVNGVPEDLFVTANQLDLFEAGHS